MVRPSSQPDPERPSALWPTAWWRAVYAQGWFPMADPESGALALHRSLRRGVLPLDHRFRLPRSVRRARRQEPWRQGWQLVLNRRFEAVLSDCSVRPSTWISPELQQIYRQLHADGLAHSVEVQDAEGLAAGMLAIGIGACWIGESMAHRRPQAGNVLLVALVEALRRGGFQLFDVQLSNPHLARFGCLEIDDLTYRRALAQAVSQPASLRLEDGALSSEAWMPQ
ncbi:MAG: leucyl/phenylalanyl-tRNA--protein transferase [Synechococcaceae cyanobacterium]